MPDFVGHSTASSPDENLQVDDFFPDISCALLNDETRNDISLQDEEQARYLKQAMYRVNDDLSAWRAAQTVESLASVEPSETNHRTGEQLVHHYTTAVLAYARAEVLTDYPDGSATGKGLEIAEKIANRISSYQAEAWSNLRKITGETRMDVELI